MLKEKIKMPERKALRLQNYDYSKNGAYFVTICVNGKHECLGSIHVGANCVRPRLSNIGQLVENEIGVLSTVYNNLSVDKYIIMPNHIHMILLINNESGRTQFAPTISRAIKQFKGSISKQVGFSLWQKSFHDHIIRNNAEYLKIWRYIDENPLKWEDDIYYERSV